MIAKFKMANTHSSGKITVIMRKYVSSFCEIIINIWGTQMSDHKHTHTDTHSRSEQHPPSIL